MFGKRLLGDSEHQTEAFLGGYFSVAGTDSLIRAAFPNIEHHDLPSHADFAKSLWGWTPAGWSDEQKDRACSLMARLMDPLPSRRARIDLVLAELPEALPTQNFAQLRFVARKQATFTISMPSPELPPSLKPHVPLPKPDSMWSQLGNWRVPIPLAIHAVLIRRECGDASFKTLLYLLRAVHRFSFAESLSLQRESVLQLLPSIRFDCEVWKMARMVQGQPFLVCCLAAWVHVHGTSPPDVETLSSDAMQTVLQSPDVDVFFGSFGLQWKSQRSMLESWRRL